jgi:hypothetical protein
MVRISGQEDVLDGESERDEKGKNGGKKAEKSVNGPKSAFLQSHRSPGPEITTNPG